MELLYQQEHLSCFNYQNGEAPLIEFKNSEKRLGWLQTTKVHEIIFVTKGILECSYGEVNSLKLTAGNAILIPAGYNVTCEALLNTSLVVFRIHKKIQLCDRFHLSQLMEVADVNHNVSPFLKIKDCLSKYLTDLQCFVESGLKCFHYFELKINEFLFILRAYYTKEELVAFFSPLISPDVGFAHMVLINQQYAKNVKDLAQSVNYSVSGFEKHFKKTFGVSAGKWLKERRAINIYHEINSSQKSFKSICGDFGFSSITYFNDYCKAQFGMTPGEIRKQITKSTVE